MTKRNLLLVSLLAVFGLGVMVPVALAQAPVEGEGTVMTVSSSEYTLRPNSNGDAGGPIFLNFVSGYGTIAGGEAITITYSEPIVGANAINTLWSSDEWYLVPQDFCDDSHSTVGGVKSVGWFCNSVSYYASGNTLTLTNGTSPIGPWTGGYITIWGLRAATVGLSATAVNPITAQVSAALNQSYPLSFTIGGATQSGFVNVGQIANVGGTLSATMYATNILTCYGTEEAGFDIYIAEDWAGAWTSLTDEFILAPFAPSANYSPTNGSNISISLTGIPYGVQICPETVHTEGYSETFAAAPSCYTGVKANDSTTFDFVLTHTLRTELEAADFPFGIVAPSSVPPNSPPIVATVTLNPLGPSATNYPAFQYPVQGLPAEPSSPFNAVTFVGCQTNLLYPYVTNYITGASGGPEGNWDTALEVSNTTSDPFTYTSWWWDFDGVFPTAGATPMVGSCTFYVYNGFAAAGVTPPTTAATPLSWTSPLVPSGGIYAVMLSNTPAKGSTGGYAIAICNFQHGSGWAAQVDNANGLGNWQVMAGYLAPTYE